MKYGLHIRDPCPPSGSGGEVCDEQRKDHGGILAGRIGLCANRDKTEQSCFESSYACTLETAFADMRQTKERCISWAVCRGITLCRASPSAK